MTAAQVESIERLEEAGGGWRRLGEAGNSTGRGPWGRLGRALGETGGGWPSMF